MADFKEFADQLQHEVVTDMAESYFGARKDLDDMIDAFNLMVEEFRQMGPKLSQAAAVLHHLLLDRETARDFYISLDIVPSCIPFGDVTPRPFFDPLPFAFTGGRYQKCVFRAYDIFQKTADEYLNGVYYEDPEFKGRKRLTVHYLRLKALCEHINDEVERVNGGMSPSGALRYLKTMDPVRVEQEKMIGEACLVEGAIDKELLFLPIDFEALSLPIVQDLPALYKVKPLIKEFCEQIYPSRKHDVQAAMAGLRDG